MPFHAADFAPDANIQIVLLADANLGRMQDALGAVVQTQQDVDVVVEPPAFDENRRVGRQFLDLQAGDVFDQIFGMSPDVADAPARAALGGSVRQTACFCPVASSNVANQPCGYSTTTLRTLPNLPRANKCASLLDNWITRVSVSQPVEQLVLATKSRSFFASAKFNVAGLSLKT